LSKMKYQNRTIEALLKEYMCTFPVVAVTGPRQSGKSTLVKQMLNGEYRYITLDDYRIIDQLEDDPERFISTYENRVIFDEVQKYPKIFNLIKRRVDENRDVYGRYVLTGSSQFTLQHNISETLAGRIGLLQLLPFDISELPDANVPIEYGCYPEQVMRNHRANEAWYGSYLETYIQRDVRSVATIGAVHDFSRFIKLLSANVSQQLNASYYSKSLGVSVPTIKRWLSVLEFSYIIYLLKPYHSNLNKRIVKSPKIFFYDTGLAAYLNGAMGTRWEDGPLAGPIFENYIVSECVKRIAHRGLRDELYYFREHNGDEIDIIIEGPDKRQFIEIKHSMTFRPGMIKHLEKYMDEKTKSILLYQGESMDYTRDILVKNCHDYLLFTG